MEKAQTWFFILNFLQGEDTASVVVEYENGEPSNDDWVAVFSPAKFK